MSTGQISPEALARAHPAVLASMCKVRTPGKISPLRLWPAQRRLCDLIESPDYDTILVLKSRQTGITQGLGLHCLSRAFRVPASHSLIVSKGDREAVEASARVRQMYASLPAQVKQRHAIYHKNLEEFRLTHPDLPEPVGALEDAITCDIRNLPAGAGRSYSSDFLVCDEFDHWDDAEGRLADIAPTLAMGSKLVIASTANGYGNALHTRWLRARNDPRTATLFVGALDRPGRTPEWVERQREQLGHLGPQEFPLTPEEAFIATGHGVFDPEHIGWQTEYIARPPGGTYVIRAAGPLPVARRHPSGPWGVWEPPAAGRRYVLAADCAGGGPHSDPSAAAIYDIDSGTQVAAYHGRPLPHEFAREIASAGMLYGSALLVPESNNHGQAVIAHLLNLGYPNLWQEERFVAPGQPAKKSYGFATTQNSKQFAVDSLRDALRGHTQFIRDADAIEEMMRFAEVAPGRYAARTGHDDRCIAHCIAAAVLSHSRQASFRPVPVSIAGPMREVLDEVTGY